MTRWSIAAVTALAAMTAASSLPAQSPLPTSSLAVRDGDAWRTMWRSDQPSDTARETTLLRVIRWQPGVARTEWGTLALAGAGEAWRTRLVVVRARPESIRFTLDTAFMRAAPNWSLARLAPHAALAVNAGQFTASLPWGWVVLDGRQWLPPQRGPLAAALAQDSAGTLRWVRDGDITTFAASRRGVRWAFQSYPVLVAADTIPAALRAAGLGLDVAHRDARAAICLDHAGRLIIALTRFDALGAAADFLPFGLTIPEMAALMRSLGCRDAMALDGGISAQLRVRDAHETHDWRGVRKVPLALVGIPVER